MAHSVLPTDPVAETKSNASTRSRTLLIVKGIIAAGFVMLIAECLRIFVGSNFHTVLPGECYRSAQPTPTFLEDAKRTHGIRTIINLRDWNEDDWYNKEVAACNRLGIKLVDAGLSSKEQPPAEDFHRFVKAIKNAETPVLIHCANGNDRSGYASAVYLMTHTDMPIPEARRQLGLRYGHLSWTKASCLQRLLDSYDDWLKETGKPHSADHFYYWGLNVFQPEAPRRFRLRLNGVPAAGT